MTKTNKIQTKFRACHSITTEINEFVKESKVMNGLLTVSLPNTTTGLGITSFWDPLGLDDMLDEIDRSFPTKVHYKLQTSPYDSSGHIKSTIFKNSVNILIQEGKLMLGSSQGLVLMDFDGPQIRDYHFKMTNIDQRTSFTSISIDTKYMGMHDLTKELADKVRESKINNGVIHIAVMHSTAGLVMADSSKESYCEDFMNDIEKMIPTRVDFKHRETASDAGGHIKTALTGTQLTLTIINNEIVLGENQGVYFAEFDGPRPRKVVVGILEREEI